MRFIHAADIHLDSPLYGLSAYPDAPAEQLRSATREAFTQLKSLTLQQKLTLVAEGCRDGLATLKHHRGSMFEGFPRATCGPTSEIVGRILKVVFQMDGIYVDGLGHPGLSPDQSHAWFEVDAYLVDIGT